MMIANAFLLAVVISNSTVLQNTEPVGTVSSDTLITSVSVNLFSTIFFQVADSPNERFENLPYETASIEIMNGKDAVRRGFLTSSSLANNEDKFVVAIESWQRFKVVRAHCVKEYSDAIQSGELIGKNFANMPIAQELEKPAAEKANSEWFKTLAKVGVAFRIILAAEREPTGNANATTSEVVNQIYSGSSRVFATIEIAGAGSDDLTRKLPGVLELYGKSNLDDFLTKAKEARNEIWSSRSVSSEKPQMQILGWVFPKKKKSTADVN